MDFAQIALLLVVAGVFGLIAKLLRQPLLIGYLFAGLVLGAMGFVQDTQALTSFGQIGVALLLFLLGLEMNLSELPTIGRVALITGLGQIIFTSVIGFVIAQLFGFGLLPAVYLAIALTFSSTIIIVKLLSEKKDLSSLYGRISVGFLLIQDFVAVVILMFLSGLGQGGQTPQTYLLITAKAVLLFGLVWGLSKKVLPTLFDKFIAGSSELLFIVSIAWALGVATLVAGPLGFTLEIGGFLAGLALSNLPEHLQIASRTRPLRDFFLTIFFLLLGAQLVIGAEMLSIIFPAIVFSLFVLLGNPVIVLSIMGFLGYRKRTSFMAGLTVAQISEFSLILVAVGAGLGHLNQSHVALTVLVGIITMTTSTYFITGSNSLYKKLGKFLDIFERKRTKEGAFIKESDLKDHVVLVGSDRTGKAITAYLDRNNTPFLVVDFNPKVFKQLTAENIPVVYGDISDPEILEASNLDKAKMLVSTTADLENNLTILEFVKGLKFPPLTMFTTRTRHEGIALYEKGADYVIVPEVVAGEHIKHLLNTYGVGSERIAKMGKNHFNRLIFK